VLEAVSGLKFNVDFTWLQPERINPGDKLHRVSSIKKGHLRLDAGKSPNSSISSTKRSLSPGTHKAPSIRVAEAAKVIENTQRDLNIALINELAIIFNRMASTPRRSCRRPAPNGISCRFVLASSAATVSGWTRII